jgi:hypothetical protein
MIGICSFGTSLWHWRLAAARCAVLGVLLIASYGCAAPPTGSAAAIAAPVPPGKGRVWIYRDYEPSETLGRPYVRLNGAIAGISEPGGSFYRDVQPGSYSVTVDSVGRDVYQFVDLTVAPATTAFVKIESARLWESDLSYRADTFYTRVMPSETAGPELARTRFFGGS